MQKKKKHKLGIAAVGFLVATTAVACMGEDEVESGPVLANIQTEGGTTIEFYEIEATGAIVVSEVGPAEVPSKLALLAEEDATPLEIYLALTQGDDAPLELEIHHDSVTDAEPRHLDLSFRAWNGSVTAGDCSVAGDADWFGDWMAFTTWFDTDYWSGVAVLHDIDNTTDELLTHLCNHAASGGTGSMSLKVVEPIDGIAYYTVNGIDTGERGVILLTSGSSANYRSRAVGPAGGQTNTIRHGVMMP